MANETESGVPEETQNWKAPEVSETAEENIPTEKDLGPQKNKSKEWVDEGPNKRVMELEDEEYKKFDRNFKERAEIRGMQMAVEWDINRHDYVVYLPQIDTESDEAYEKGINDNMIDIATDPELAEVVYGYMKEKAETIKDVYELFNDVKKFSDFARRLNELRESKK